MDSEPSELVDFHHYDLSATPQGTDTLMFEAFLFLMPSPWLLGFRTPGFPPTSADASFPWASFLHSLDCAHKSSRFHLEASFSIVFLFSEFLASVTTYIELTGVFLSLTLLRSNQQLYSTFWLISVGSISSQRCHRSSSVCPKRTQFPPLHSARILKRG